MANSPRSDKHKSDFQILSLSDVSHKSSLLNVPKKVTIKTGTHIKVRLEHRARKLILIPNIEGNEKNRGTAITVLTYMINSGSPQAKELNAFWKNKQSNKAELSRQNCCSVSEGTSDKQPASSERAYESGGKMEWEEEEWCTRVWLRALGLCMCCWGLYEVCGCCTWDKCSVYSIQLF